MFKYCYKAKNNSWFLEKKKKHRCGLLLNCSGLGEGGEWTNHNIASKNKGVYPLDMYMCIVCLQSYV
jgi:hypothetical protein